MAQKNVLDLDSLLVEQQRIVFADGTTIVLRDLTTDEMLGPVLQRLSALRALVGAEVIGKILEVIAYASEDDEPTVRLKMRPAPLSSLFDLITWMQSANAAAFEVPEPKVIGSVVLAGRERNVRMLTVGTFMSAVEADEAMRGGGDMQVVARKSLEIFADGIEDTTIEEILALPQSKRRALEAFISQSMDKELASLKEKLSSPSPKRAKRRRR